MERLCLITDGHIWKISKWKRIFLLDEWQIQPESWFNFTHNWVTPLWSPLAYKSIDETEPLASRSFCEACWVLCSKMNKLLHSGTRPPVMTWAKVWKMQCSDFAWFLGINIMKKFWITPKHILGNVRSARRRGTRAWSLPWLCSPFIHTTKTALNKCPLM